MKTSRIGLTFAILSSLACLLLLTWLLLSLISFKTAEKDLLAQKIEESRLLLSAFVALLPQPLVAPTGGAPVALLASTLAAETGFKGITAVDARGAVIYSLNDPQALDEGLRTTLQKGLESSTISGNGMLLFRYKPVIANGRMVGAARLSLSLTGEYERLQKSRHLFLAYFVLDFLLLLGLGSFILARIVVRPIKKLLAATEKITAGDYNYTVHVPGSAEISELAEAFNAMSATLRTKREEVENHVKSLEKANLDLQMAREETLRSEKMASVGLLAAGMAHEVGTPLSAIIGYAGILRDEVAGNPEQADYVHRIEQEAERIDRLVRDLLNYARPGEVEYEYVDVEDFLKNIIEMLSRQGIFKKIQISIYVEKGLPPLSLDRHQLMQVLINLLINARDAMPDGGTIGVRAESGVFAVPGGNGSIQGAARGRRKDDFHGAFHVPFLPADQTVSCIRIEVRDSGEGIAAEHLERIFDPFFTTKEPGKGTGLGLAICARIIDTFGGRIVVKSNPCEGTTFVIFLPAAITG